MKKTLNELLKEDICWITEYEGLYYVKLDKEMSDDVVWKVDVKTGKAVYIQIVEYLLTVEENNPKEIDPKSFKEEMLM